MKHLIVLVILAASCLPGEPPRDALYCACVPGTHCVGDFCVPGPEPDAAPPPPPIPTPIDGPCRALGFDNVDEVEARFIAPRCGMSKCHGSSSVFPPKGLDRPELLRNTLVDRKAALVCKNDFYVNRKNPEKSLLLAKIEATTNVVTCPSGGEGGMRMPNADDKPGVAGERLPDDQLECLRWWVFQIASR